MPQIPVFKHSIGGSERSNRVRVEATDPSAAGSEIVSILPDRYQVDEKDIAIVSLGANTDDCPDNELPAIMSSILTAILYSTTCGV